MQTGVKLHERVTYIAAASQGTEENGFVLHDGKELGEWTKSMTTLRRPHNASE